MNKFLFVFLSLCIFGQQVQSTTNLLSTNVKELNGDLHPKHRHLSEEGQLNLRIAGRGYFQFRLPVTLTDASGDESQKRRLNTFKEKDDTCSSDSECKSFVCDSSCTCRANGYGTPLESTNAVSLINGIDKIKQCCSLYAHLEEGKGQSGGQGEFGFCAETSRPVDDSGCFGETSMQCGFTTGGTTRCNPILKPENDGTFFSRCDCGCNDNKLTFEKYKSSKFYAITKYSDLSNNEWVVLDSAAATTVTTFRFDMDSFEEGTSKKKFPSSATNSVMNACATNKFGWRSWVINALKINKEKARGISSVNGNDNAQYCIAPEDSSNNKYRPLGSFQRESCDPTISCFKDGSPIGNSAGTQVGEYLDANTKCRERCPGTVKFSDCPTDVVSGATYQTTTGASNVVASCPLTNVNSGFHFKGNRDKDGIFVIKDKDGSIDGELQVLYETNEATTIVGGTRVNTKGLSANTKILGSESSCCTIEICDIDGENCFNQQPEPPAAAETPKQCNNDCPTCGSANSCIESPNSCNWKPIDTSEGDCVSAATYDEAYAASPPPNNTQVSGGLPDKGDGTNSVEATDDGDGDDKTISEVVYGKDGSLHVNKFGYLVDDNGFLLVSESRNTNDENAKFHIHIPSRADDLIVTPTGKILAMELGGGSINKVGQLKIVRFENAQGLNVRLQMKSNCYAAGESGFNLGNWCQGSTLDGKDHTYMSETEVSGPGIVGNPGDQGFGRILKSK